jgi:hypothetical protein
MTQKKAPDKAVDPNDPSLNQYERADARDAAIVEGKAKGLTNKQIGQMLGMSGDSVSMKIKATPKLHNLMRETNTQAAERLGLSRSRVLTGYVDAINVADTAGEQIKGWDSINKMLGYSTPEEVIHKHDLTRLSRKHMAQLSDADLMQMTLDAELMDQVIEGDFVEVVDDTGAQE